MSVQGSVGLGRCPLIDRFTSCIIIIYIRVLLHMFICVYICLFVIYACVG